MVAKSHIFGNEIIYDGECWIFADTREPVAETYQDRACGHCGKHSTIEGHDACLGTLPGVMNACCGHDINGAYIQFLDGFVVSGKDAMIIQDILKKKEIFDGSREENCS